LIVPILEVRNLKKSFGAVAAVSDVSFSVAAGECFGLLGPNGAGKTTTLEILEGVQDASGGTILYKGVARSKEYSEEIGIQFQETSLPDFLTVRDVLTLFSSYYRNRRSIEEIVQVCALQEFLDRDTRKLSGGQRQRMLLGLALVNRPKLLFLDEPTTGLDPQARRNFWDLITKVKAEGTTVLLSTHYMDEAYRLCDRIIIMDHGKIIAEGSPKSLLSEHFRDSIVELPGTLSKDIDLGRWQEHSTRHEDVLTVVTHEVNDLIGHLLINQIDLRRLRVKEMSLEDLFIKLTGRDLRQ
jgi:ABC-2 type transport system ATP-binding protein